MITKFKFWLHTFLASFAKPSKEQAYKQAIEHRLFEIKLTDRKEEKLEAYKEWSKPENIAKRKAKLEEEAPLALARGKAMAELAKAQIAIEPLEVLDVSQRLANVGIKLIGG